MIRPLLLAALIALPAVASAQTTPATGTDGTAEAGSPPQRVRSVTLGVGQKWAPRPFWHWLRTAATVLTVTYLGWALWTALTLP